MQTSNPMTPVFLTLIVLAVIATAGAERRWRAWLTILGWMLAGFAFGAGIGFAFGSSALAGNLAGGLMDVMGIGASIEIIRRNSAAKRQRKEQARRNAEQDSEAQRDLGANAPPIERTQA